MVKLYYTLSVFVFAALIAIESVYAKQIIPSIIAEVLRQSGNDNVLVSPYLVLDGLIQLYYGGQGKTKDKLLELFEVTDAVAFERFMNNSYSIQASRDGVKLYVGNRLFVSEDVSIMPEYREKLGRIHNSPVESVNFADSAAAVSKINDWVAATTKSKITKLIEKTEPNSKILFMSAIYFTGLWRLDFDSVHTKRSPFRIPLADGGERTVEVDMMSREGYFPYKYVEQLDADAIKIKYSIPSAMYMIIIVPRTTNGIQKVVDMFDTLQTTEFEPDAYIKRLRLTLPKFRLESNIKLKDVLRALDKNCSLDANLKDTTDLNKPLEITEFFQKAVVEVNEKGASPSDNREKSDNWPQIKADHPFLFVIRDKQKVYLAGRVSHPE
ncbi:serine protease inhibitor 42Dd-like [Drosophila montana]|uniref:serine protease inhibitor 42Dd-like n=1 Tax=Drosophila montana TaxID=40370 RepID=UPI00313B8C75